MQGIEQIAWQNACVVALDRAAKTGESQYVYRDPDNQLTIGDESALEAAGVPAERVLYEAKPDGLAV